MVGQCNGTLLHAEPADSQQQCQVRKSKLLLISTPTNFPIQQRMYAQNLTCVASTPSVTKTFCVRSSVSVTAHLKLDATAVSAVSRDVPLASESMFLCGLQSLDFLFLI